MCRFYYFSFRIVSFGRTEKNNFNITPIVNPSGIYFHSINNLRVHNSYWRFLTYINITNYNEKYNIIDSMTKQIGESCKLGQTIGAESLRQTCVQYNYQAKNFLSEISNNIEHVMKIIETPIDNYRVKRGLINIVGRLTNVLFGICDDVDAEYFYDKIKELETSKLHVSQLTDTQTQIMRSIISNVNSSMLEMEKVRVNLIDKYNYLTQEVQAKKINIDILNFEAALEEQISLLNLILIQYAFETENLVNIINMAIQGLVHSSVLNTGTFRTQLKDIKTQLPTGEDIPVNLNDSGVSELLRLTTTNIVYIKDLLVFNIEIPLINSYEFILYKTIPLPINLFNNTYVTIVPTIDYIAIDKSRLYYLELNEIELAKCKQTKKALICPYDQQLYHLDKICELMLFRKPDIIPDSCNLRNVNFNFSIWHRLENTNSWIYITNKDTIIVKCKDMSEVEVTNVNGTGILELSNQCEANTGDGTLLIPKRKVTTKVYKDIIPRLNTSFNLQFPVIGKDIISNNLIQPNRSETIIKNNLHKLIEYSSSLESFKPPLTTNDTIIRTNIQFYIILGTVIISMGLLISINLYFKLRKECRKTSSPIEETVEDKIYEKVTKPNHESTLPRIV